jgi:serine/threonine-protein kinase
LHVPGFTILKRFPTQGMTDIALAVEESGARVVLRTLRPQYAANRTLRKQFEHGARVLDQLEHPHVVRLRELGDVGGMPYMTVDYHEGQNLRERIARRWPELHQRQLALVRQAASALHHVHRRGFLHMDLKPENLLITDDVRAVLLDFDLAVEHSGQPLKLKELQGTASYFAPETLQHHVVDEASEVYVFGVCMYELLTLHKPFDSNSQEAYRRAVSDPRRAAHPLRRHRPGIPAPLEAVILKCLAKDPGSRYPSMALVLHDLDALS